MTLGTLGLGLSALGFTLNSNQFFKSYFLGYLFWIQLPLGSLAFLMLLILTNQTWAKFLTPIFVAAIQSFGLLTVLFIPIFLGVKSIYPWATLAVHANQLSYLNIRFFAARALCYFLIWNILSYLLIHSKKEDYTRYSGPGLVLFALTTTFSCIDWCMSLEPEWFSTVYGMIFGVAQMLLAFAFSLAVLCFLIAPNSEAQDYAYYGKIITRKTFTYFGNILLTFIIMWTYLSFVQYFLIWNGNLPKEVPWVIRRTQGGWQTIIILLVLFQFTFPFLFLLFRSLKQKPYLLGKLAFLVVCLRCLDVYWYVAPAFHPNPLSFHWMTLTSFLGIGSFWMALFVRNFNPTPPAQSLRIEGSLCHD